MNVAPRGKWSLVSIAGYGPQPPCRGVGKVVKAGPDTSCLKCDHEVVFLDIECGVLKVSCESVLVHEDYIVATACTNKCEGFIVPPGWTYVNNNKASCP